jgi:hypothetical protein
MELNPHLIQELKLKSASDLKALLPIYPTVKKQEEGKEIVFKTLVRKKYEGVYYLIPMEFKGDTEARTLHGLHSRVHNYLMLGVHHFLDVKDDDQINEVTRLKNL